MSDNEPTTEAKRTETESSNADLETVTYDEQRENEPSNSARNTVPSPEDPADRREETTEIDPASSEVLYRTSPLVRPVLGLIGTAVVIAAIGGAVVMLNPSIVGGPELANIVLNAILLLTAVVVIRLGIKVLILRKTTYTIRTDGFESSYRLAYRENERKIPHTQLRGQELDRGRYQSLFGCATIRLLTGGTNRSLGFVEFQSVPDPETVQEMVSDVWKANERSK